MMVTVMVMMMRAQLTSPGGDSDDGDGDVMMMRAQLTSPGGDSDDGDGDDGDGDGDDDACSAYFSWW